MSDNHCNPSAAARKSRRRKPKKPEKPYPNFPLFAHATKRWAKKILGKLHYFGPWDDPDGALTKYLEQKDALHAGRTPRVAAEGLTVRDLLNRFLTHKRHLLDTREIAPQSFQDYHLTCKCIIDAFGRDRLVSDLAADDFERLRVDIAKQWGPVRLGNTIQRVRSVFRFGYEAGLIDKPVRFGPGFKRPSRKVLRLERAKRGPRMFEREEILVMLRRASPILKAMILLGVNAGLGNTDAGRLLNGHLDLAGAWLNYPRPKTGIERRAKLWPETVAALREVLARRPRPKDAADADLVFLTQRGLPWVKTNTRQREDGSLQVVCDDAISKETKKLLTDLGINGHRNFYALRHTFETIGGEARDQVAVNAIMGHVDDTMAGLYRERISDARLSFVSQNVHDWLFAESQTPPVE
jgi:integrase